MSVFFAKYPYYMRKLIIALVMLFISILLIKIDFDDHDSIYYSNNAIKKDGFYFDTYVSFTIFDSEENYNSFINSKEDIDSLLSNCIDMCETYETIFSRTLEGSELYLLNKSIEFSPETNVELSEDLYKCIEATLLYSKSFGNKFSILSGDLCDLWDYNKAIVPERQNIDMALTAINSYSISLNDNYITLKKMDTVLNNPTLQATEKNIPSINLGASAKGYITDKICTYLKSKGIKEAVIDIGGNIAVIGDKYDNSMYKIGIKKPFSTEGDPIAVCKLSDKTIVTSGIYERYFTKDNHIFHHIIDCTTGYPTENDILSITIIADNSLLADCYSTGCLLLGVTDSLDFINSSKDAECVIIDKDYQIILSDGLMFDDSFITFK